MCMPVFIKEYGIYRKQLTYIFSEIFKPGYPLCLVNQKSQTLFMILNRIYPLIKCSASRCISLRP